MSANIIGVRSKAIIAHTTSFTSIRTGVGLTILTPVIASIVNLVRILADTSSLSGIGVGIGGTHPAFSLPPVIVWDTNTCSVFPGLVVLATGITSVGQLIVLFSCIHAIAGVKTFVGEGISWAFHTFLGIVDRILVTNARSCGIIVDFICSTSPIFDAVDSISDETIFTEANSVEEDLIGSTSSKATSTVKDDTLRTEIALTLPEVSSFFIAIFDEDAGLALTGITIARNISVDNSPDVVNKGGLFQGYWA